MPLDTRHELPIGQRVGGGLVTDLSLKACKEWKISDNLEIMEMPRALTVAAKNLHFPLVLMVFGLERAWVYGTEGQFSLLDTKAKKCEPHLFCCS